MLAFLLFAEEQKNFTFLDPTIMIFGLALLFMFIVVGGSSRRRQEAERQALLNNLQKNDRIVTIGGIYAHIVNVSDTDDEVLVKVEDNLKMKITKLSVHRNISAEERAKSATTANKEPAK